MSQEQPENKTGIHLDMSVFVWPPGKRYIYQIMADMYHSQDPTEFTDTQIVPPCDLLTFSVVHKHQDNCILCTHAYHQGDRHQ